jgi:hypothetical protein
VNRAEIVHAVRYRLGNPTNEPFFTDPVLNSLVNEALQVVAAEDDWPWLQATTTFSTVSGTQTYTPPADWTRTKGLVIDGYAPIEWRTLAEIRAAGTTERQFPTYFTTFAEDILLAPVPDSAYTVRHDYYVSEAELSADTDTPVLPAQFHFAVVAKAVELGHLRQRDTQRAEPAQAEYRSWLDRMRKHMSRSKAPKRVRIRPGRAI